MIHARIHPTGVYDREALTRTLGLQATTLRREVRLGRLATHRIGKRSYFIGAEVLRWIEAAPSTVERTPEELTA